MNEEFIDTNITLRDAIDTEITTVNGTLFHTLVIPARVVNNDSTIVCVAFAGNRNVSSERAILTKQGKVACGRYVLYTSCFLHMLAHPCAFTYTGLLASVGIVSVVNGSNSIYLSWSPPFSLDVTGVDPDVWYTIQISNVTDEDNPVTIEEYSNHTQLYVNNNTFPSPFFKLSFVIIPQNGAGAGNKSDPVIGAFISGNILTYTCISNVIFHFLCRI